MSANEGHVTLSGEMLTPTSQQFIVRSGARYVIAGILALSMTFLLLLGMQKLIAGGNEVMTDPAKGNVLDFIRLKKDEAIVKKERKPQKPAKPKEPPPPMTAPTMQQSNPNNNAVKSSFAADIQTDMGLSGGLSLDSGDGCSLYPIEASQHQLC